MEGFPSTQILFEQVYEHHSQGLYAYFVGRRIRRQLKICSRRRFCVSGGIERACRNGRRNTNELGSLPLPAICSPTGIAIALLARPARTTSPSPILRLWQCRPICMNDSRNENTLPCSMRRSNGCQRNCVRSWHWSFWQRCRVPKSARSWGNQRAPSATSSPKRASLWQTICNGSRLTLNERRRDDA